MSTNIPERLEYQHHYEFDILYLCQYTAVHMMIVLEVACLMAIYSSQMHCM